MNRLVSVDEAAKALGVSIQTLRRWGSGDRLLPDHTEGGHRRYNLAKLKPELFCISTDERSTQGGGRVGTMLIAHKIRLMPNNKQSTYFARAASSVGCAACLAVYHANKRGQPIAQEQG